MTEPSNSNLEGPGHITIVPDKERKALRMSIHFVTTHLQPHEAHVLIYRLFQVGIELYGPAWGAELFKVMGAIPVNDIDTRWDDEDEQLSKAL